MRPPRIILALVFLVIPVMGRYLWFYNGIYTHPETVTIPNFTDFTISTPLLSTPHTPAFADEFTGKSVLMDQTHQNNYNSTEIEPLILAIKASGAEIRFTGFQENLSRQLSRADAFVITTPTIAYNQDEISAINHFVDQGGRLLVLTDPTRKYSYPTYYNNPIYTMDGIGILNALLQPYDIFIQDDFVFNVLENEGNFRHVIFRDFLEDPITTGIKEIVLYSSLPIQSNQKRLILGSSNMRSSGSVQGEDVVVAVRSGENILVIGDMTFLTNPYNLVSDNPILINNIAHYLVSGQKSAVLDDFPNIFSDDLYIYLPSEISMDTKILSKMGSVQNFARFQSRSVYITREYEDERDQLILATYDQTGILSQAFSIFQLQVYTNDQDEGLKSVSIPDIGSFPVLDVGLFLFVPEPKGNRLFLVADSFNSIESLIDIFNSNSLNACYIVGNMAICPVSPGFSTPFTREITEPENGINSEDQNLPIDNQFPATEEPELIPEPLVTPVG